MMRRLGDIRLIPIVLVAIIALFALKAFGLIFGGGRAGTQGQPPGPQGRHSAGTFSCSGAATAGTAAVVSRARDPGAPVGAAQRAGSARARSRHARGSLEGGGKAARDTHQRAQGA